MQIGVSLFLQHRETNTGPLTQAGQALLLCHALQPLLVLIGPSSAIEPRSQPLPVLIGSNSAIGSRPQPLPVLIGSNSATESRPQPSRLWIGTNGACCPTLMLVIEEELLVHAQCQPLGEHPARAVNSRAVRLVLQDICG